MKRTLSFMLIALALVLTAIPAMAAPARVAGEWTYVPTIVGAEEVGSHLVLFGEDVGTWTGTFDGTSTEDFIVVVHATGNNYYRGLIEFTGTVAGRPGTMTLQTEGIQIPGGLEPGTGGDWHGRWMILGGTGELEHLSGVGTFSGPSLDLDYVGKIQFGGEA